MTDMPLVSVVIATCNRAHLLRQAIESVLAQDYPEFEIIIVDDCSTDRTPEVVAAIGEEHERVRSMRLPQNSGASAARNAGIRGAQGGLIAFLDDDDKWLPGKLSAQVNALQAHPESALCYAKALSGSPEGIATTRPYVGTDRGRSGDNFENQLRYHAIKTPTVLVRAEVLEEVGLFDEKLPTAEDTDLFLRITLHHPATYLPDPVAVVREHPGRMTRDDKRAGRQDRCTLTVLGRLWDDLPPSRSSLRGLVAEHLAHSSLALARSESGGPPDAGTIQSIVEEHADWFRFPESHFPLALAYAACGSSRQARAAARRAIEQPKMSKSRKLAAWALCVWPTPAFRLWDYLKRRELP
ncbi:MAG: glycosyltransferase family 2 protein [candidate division WS1 bacterium]|jgi:glycosyltransferase involved in cell wall biosynthesis|nr:glycosyltransferase family 2 protein [candidate division WS1 bacterium]